MAWVVTTKSVGWAQPGTPVYESQCLSCTRVVDRRRHLLAVRSLAGLHLSSKRYTQKTAGCLCSAFMLVLQEGQKKKENGKGAICSHTRKEGQVDWIFFQLLVH